MRRLCQPGAKCLGRSPRGDVWEFKEPLARITRTAIEGGAVLPDAERKWVWARRLAAAVAMAALATQVKQVVPYTDRKRVLPLPEAVDAWIGHLVVRDTPLKEAALPKGHEFTKLLDRVLQRLLGGLRDDSVDEPGLARFLRWNWTITLVDSPVVNAYCFPGGRVVVHTGLIDRMDSEEKVALCVAHEVAHALARHGTEKLLCRLAAMGPAPFLGEAPRAQSPPLLPFSRASELEADAIGLHLAVAAGYRITEQTVTTMQELLHQSPRASSAEGRKRGLVEQHPALASVASSLLDLFNRVDSTHPSQEERVASLLQLLPDVVAKYDAKRSSPKQPRNAWYQPFRDGGLARNDTCPAVSS
ncbi:Mitochondrial metalloendopeptidase OMA1 [Diplonema papillatum]|nr:Mitochondrial metalloendopeptidase OMA1 [Diplonema papillatum]KAJ9451291.1 Mitochondrial metalloendopeptidase OMA1 [Diplonema papillatum]